MRAPAGAVILLLALVPAAMAQDGPWPPGHHSPSVEAFTWEPRAPARGMPVTGTVTLNVTDPDRVVLRACRVEAYSCLQPILMDAVGDGQNATYRATVPWTAGFFRDVTQVGLSVLVRHADGTEEESPVVDWPERPAALPAEADRYYFYTLPPPSQGTPGPAFLLAGIALLLAASGRRRA